MDLRGWESLWKIFATIGIANILFFVIAIESACYLGVLIVRRHIRQILR
jgi:hypothetical protein